MNRIVLRLMHSAGMPLGIFLLASAPAFAQYQQVARSGGQTQSIMSLAPSLSPQGSSLARTAHDATFKNAPSNYHIFSAANVGQSSNAELLTLNFAGETTLTAINLATKDFVIEPGGSCYVGNHYNRGESCALLVGFHPQGPGHRLGFLKVAHSAESTPVSFGLVGNSYAPVINFTPAQITSIAGSVSSGTGTISSATNLAIDGGDILYIPDTGNNKLKEMDSSGNINPTTLGPIAVPASLAVDSFGIVYTANQHGQTYYFSIFYPWGSQTAYGYAYASSTCTAAAPCAFSAVGMNYPANMSIDAYDDLIFEEGTSGAAEMPVSSISGGSGTLNLWHLSDQFAYSSGKPGAFAVDAGGNLYTSYSFSTTTCYLLEESLYSAEYSPTANRVAGGTACGFTGDGGLARGAEISSTIGQIAFDIAGNLYFADAGNQRVRRIDARTGIISTVAGTGKAGYSGDVGAATNATLSNPTGVAVDSQGQVYILSNAPTAGPTQAIRKIGTRGYWNFPSQLAGTTSSKVFTISNNGNDIMTLSSAATFVGANPADFSVDPNLTSCVLTAGATLAAGRTCQLGIIFKPAAAGSRSASLLLHGNTVTGTNTILLFGTGTTAPSKVAITAPTSGATVANTSKVTFTARVTSDPSIRPTGMVTFKLNGTAIGKPVELSTTGTASTTFSAATAGTYTLAAIYSGDAAHAGATATEKVTVKAGAAVEAVAEK